MNTEANYMKEPKALIDSNILVYSIDRSEEEKYVVAKELVQKLIDEGFFLSVQNLTEFYSVSTQKIERPIEHTKAKKFIEYLEEIEEVKIKPLKTENLMKGTEITEKHDTDYWDALIAAVMKENNVEKIYTENTGDFKAIKGIEAKNPFK